MSDRSRWAAGAAHRSDGSAGLDARGRALHEAAEDAARAKARRNAWVLAGTALFVYVGYIVWMFIRANGN
jgi:hypothetical protein